MRVNMNKLHNLYAYFTTLYQKFQYVFKIK